MKKLKKLALVLLAVLMTVTAFTGCAPATTTAPDTAAPGADATAPPDADAGPEPVTLRWVGFGFEANNHAADLIARWEYLNPHVTIEYQELGATADAAGLLRLDTMIAAGDPIDIVYLTTPDFMHRVVNGAVAPLTAAVNQHGDNFTADYGLMANAVTFNGEIYGVPRAGNTFKVFYNRTLANEHGITVPDQMTFAQFREIVQQFAQIDGLDWPMIHPSTWVSLTHAPAMVAGWQPVRQEGGEWVPNYDDPRFMETVGFFRDLAIVDGLAPSTSIIAAESINRRRELAVGNTGLIVDGPFTLIWLQNFMFNDPGDGIIPFELGIANLPVLTETQKTSASYFDLAGSFFATRNSQNVFEAYRFMRFMVNDNFDVNGVFMPIYTGADMTAAVEVFRNFTDNDGNEHTDIFPLETAIAAVAAPNEAHLGVYPMPPDAIPFLGPLDVMLGGEIPVFFGGEIELEQFIDNLQQRGREVIADLSR